MALSIWLWWSLINFCQNFSHTYVSRARNSGSLLRHLKAAIFSNGMYIAGLAVMFGKPFDYLSGKHGLGPQIFCCTFYSIFTIAGSIAAHHWAQKSEKGKTAVGASKLYAQIPVEEWAAATKLLADYKRRQLAGRESFFRD